MNIVEALSKTRKEITRLQQMVSVLEEVTQYVEKADAVNLESMICKRYLQLGVADFVVKEVNSAGFRKEGKLYNSRDITKLIEQKKLDNVDLRLHSAAQLLLKINKHKT